MTVNDHIIKNMPILNTDSSSALYNMAYEFGVPFAPVLEPAIVTITAAAPGVLTLGGNITVADGDPLYFLNNNHTSGIIDFLSSNYITVSGIAGAVGNLSLPTLGFGAWSAADGGIVTKNWIGFKDHDISKHSVPSAAAPGTRSVPTNAVLVSNIGPVNIFVQQSSELSMPSAWAGVLLQPGAALHFSSGAGASLRVFDHTATSIYTVTSYG